MGELVNLFGKSGKSESGRTVYLAFTSADRKWAILPADLAEVVTKTAILGIPKGGAPWVIGVINQRGSIVPIVDFAVRLGLSALAKPQDGSIVVTQIDGKYLGFLVHSICDGLRDVAGKPVPPAAGSWPVFVRSVVHAPDGEFGLVAPAEMFSAQELQELERVRAQF